MSFRRLMQFYQFAWMLNSHFEQSLAWEDAAQARVSRARAEAEAAAQLQAMLDANPSGSLGHAAINDAQSLEESGLL